MPSLNEFFNSFQVVAVLTIIAFVLYFWLIERKPHKRYQTLEYCQLPAFLLLFPFKVQP